MVSLVYERAICSCDMAPGYEAFVLSFPESVIENSLYCRLSIEQSSSQCCGLFKEWTMSSVRSSNSGCTRIVGRARRLLVTSYLSALPTIQVHPELDGHTLDIVHCFYNKAGHLSR